MILDWRRERERERERERRERDERETRGERRRGSPLYLSLTHSFPKKKKKKNLIIHQQQRLLSLSDIISLDDFLSGWFRGAPRKAILRGNVEDFIAYGFHAQRLEDLSPEGRAGVADFVDRIQVSYNTRFEPGRNPRIEFMAHLWEPLRVVHSPLALRLALESMRLLTVLVLRVAGFRKGTVEIAEGARGGRGSSYDYWVLPAAIVEEEEAQKREKKTEKEAAKEEEERAAAAGAALLPLLRNNNNGNDVDGNKTPGRSRLGRRLRRHRSRSLTPADSASSLEEELSVDLEGEGERAGEEEDDDEEEEEASQQQRLLLRRRRRRFDGATMTSATTTSKNNGALPSASSDSRDDDDDPSTAPILFLHGVGLGITPYLLFVAALRRRFPRRPLLLLEARHVSVGLVPTRAASTCDVASAALEALRRHNWTSAAVVAHSYGTFVAARLLALSPKKVQSLVLLDPVCALTIYPQLLANFVYKPPVALLSGSERRSAEESRSRSGYFWPRQELEEEGEEKKMGEEAEKEGGGAPSSSSSPSSSPFVAAASAASSAAATARALLTAVDSARFLFSRDLTVGEAFCRRFAWHRECLWPQDLRHGGRSTLFGLAGGDDLVPSALVKRALAAAGSRARVSGSEDDPRAGHGGFLLDASWQGRLLDGAEEVIEAGAEEERAEKEKEEEKRRLPRVCGEGGDDDSGKAAAAVAAAVAAAPLSFAKAKAAAAAAACAASKLLLDDAAPDTPARPETADIGEEERRPRRSFSRQRVVPVVL